MPESFLLFVPLFLYALDYQVSGQMGSFSRIGFNNSPINSAKGLYPTGSYVTAIGALQIDMDLLPKSIDTQRLKVGIGGELGGLAYDSTKTLVDQSGDNSEFQPANWYYMGRWEGYLMNAPWRHSRYEDSVHAKNYILYNAYLDYSYKDIFGIKLGRYVSKEALFLRGFNQGFEAFVQFKHLKLVWFSTYGRGLANIQFIRDFYAPVSYEFPDGRRTNYGMHALSLAWNSKHFTVMPFLWFYPKNFNAPGLQANAIFTPGKWKIQTDVFAWFPIYSATLAKTYYRGNLVGKNTATLLVRQRFYIHDYYFGWGVYKNFGNANAQLGWNGSPVSFDTTDDTPYEDAYTNLYDANALTAHALIGGKFKNFSWFLLGKITTGPRAYAQSLGLTCKYDWKHLHLMLRINGYQISMHRGYKVAYFDAPNQKFAPSTQDRSYMMTSLSYDFKLH
ncbi:outer membrane family protein [Helicobacter felis]|uniref:Outer membrane protein, Hof family n=1 Tax=Helicobacter felis (strain ATCC 49179 / CCUG 28539 / NCTC 12436 / CS1) TaxID=936155 RepID=E7A9R8_HELFC|nr:outer membrane family protein [Helicobacter felis]CBY83388.1 outer membrane protein, Hof family [Helicobacter felis ATCC 49179]